MRAYHFTSAAHALDNLKRNRIKIATINDLNDPFELLGMSHRNRKARVAFRSWRKHMADDYGFLCFSRNWHNPLLWSHYAEKHKGVCLGFDVVDENLIDVIYSNSRIQLTPKHLEQKENAEKIMWQLLATKFSDWAYEDEVRVTCDLNDGDLKSGHCFASFSYFGALREVIAGPLCTISEEQFREIVPDSLVKLKKARLAFKSYRVVKNKQGFRGVG